MPRHSYTAKYWWKAKTQDDKEIETKLVVDNDLLLGKDNGRDVRGAEVLLWKIPDKNFWIKKEDYGVEKFCAVDESGKNKDPQPNAQEINECINVLKSAKYDYYRTEYNGGAGLHWAERTKITQEGTQTSGQAWIPYTVKIEPHHKISPQSIGNKGIFRTKTIVKNIENYTDSIAEDIKARIVAERMSKLFTPPKEFLAGSNPNDPASFSASDGNADWKKWHDVIVPLGKDGKILEKRVPDYSRKMAIQHSGNCPEINVFYSLLGPEKSSVDEILQEFRAIFIKDKNCDKILKDINNKLAEIDSLKQVKPDPLDSKLKEQEKIITDRINELTFLKTKDSPSRNQDSKTKEEIFANKSESGENENLSATDEATKKATLENGTHDFEEQNPRIDDSKSDLDKKSLFDALKKQNTDSEASKTAVEGQHKNSSSTIDPENFTQVKAAKESNKLSKAEQRKTLEGTSLIRNGKNRSLESKPKDIKTERMEVGTDGKITLNLKNSKTGDSQIVIEKDKNIFLEVDNSSGTPQVTIKNKEFREELMKYYLSDKENIEARKKYDVSDETSKKKFNNDALQVLNIYRAVPSTKIAPSDNRIIVPIPTKPR